MGRMRLTVEAGERVVVVPECLEPEEFKENLGLGLFCLWREGEPGKEFSKEEIQACKCKSVRFKLTKKGAELYNCLRPQFDSERELVRAALRKLKELPEYARKRKI